MLILSLPGLKDVSNMNPDTTLADLGLDSLMGVEVKQTLERDYDLVMPMTEIRKLTFNKLREVANSEFSSANSAESGPPRKPSSRSDGQLSTTAASRYEFDQIMPQESLVRLNEVTEGDPLFIVHPIEGTFMKYHENQDYVKHKLFVQGKMMFKCGQRAYW